MAGAGGPQGHAGRPSVPVQALRRQRGGGQAGVLELPVRAHEGAQGVPLHAVPHGGQRLCWRGQGEKGQGAPATHASRLQSPISLHQSLLLTCPRQTSPSAAGDQHTPTHATCQPVALPKPKHKPQRAFVLTARARTGNVAFRGTTFVEYSSLPSWLISHARLSCHTRPRLQPTVSPVVHETQQTACARCSSHMQPNPRAQLLRST